MSESEYVRLIEEARARNNRYWMGILKIALKHAPVETRLVLKQIKAGDLNVVFYTQKLADEAVEEAEKLTPNAIAAEALVSIVKKHGDGEAGAALEKIVTLEAEQQKQGNEDQ